jgi:hypothetical protein
MKKLKLREIKKSSEGQFSSVICQKNSIILGDMTLALQSTHIKYGLHCLACPGNEQLTFFFLPHSASLYTGKLVTLACAGERKAKKKKKKRSM